MHKRPLQFVLTLGLFTLTVVLAVVVMPQIFLERGTSSEPGRNPATSPPQPPEIRFANNSGRRLTSVVIAYNDEKIELRDIQPSEVKTAKPAQPPAGRFTMSITIEFENGEKLSNTEQWLRSGRHDLQIALDNHDELHYR